MPRTLLVSLDDGDLAGRFQAGDRDALDVLIERYRRFARAKSRGYFLMGADASDVEQEALIGLFKAARDFRPGLETPFRAFAELCITRQIISAIKAATRIKHQALNLSVPLDASAREDGQERGSTPVLPDRSVPGPADALVAAEGYHDVRAVVEDRLSALEVEVLDLFADGLSYSDIAGRLRRHTKAVDNALQRIKRKLEPALASA